jgi:hypothetical protein
VIDTSPLVSKRSYRDGECITFKLNLRNTRGKLWGTLQRLANLYWEFSFSSFGGVKKGGCDWDTIASMEAGI